MKKELCFAILMIAPLSLMVGAAPSKPKIEAPHRTPYKISQRLLDAIRSVESGGKDNCPDGDNGKAKGPFQIHREYFDDAKKYDKTLGFYDECRGRMFSEKVVRAYMSKYFNVGETDRNIAMAHNGGCGVSKKAGSKAYENAELYWKKVKEALKKAN